MVLVDVWGRVRNEAAVEVVILTELAIVLVLILINGVFSGAEIAILSLRRTRIDELVDTGSRSAISVAQLRADPERFLATVQVGITVIGATAAAFSGSSIADRVAPWIAAIPLVADFSHEIALAIVVACVSYLSLVLGELVPKSLALRTAETYALWVAPLLSMISAAARPLVWVLTSSSNLVLRLFGDSTSFSEGRLSREEIQQLVDEASTHGTVDPKAGEIASRALDFSGLDVAAVMVPRQQVNWVDRAAGLDEMARIATRSGHARVLVCGGGLDEVLGFVNLREVLARGQLDQAVDLATMIREVPFLPEGMGAPDALKELQRLHSHLAVVVDEVGTVAGLVSIEDLVEELVGEIFSENDRTPQAITKAADGGSLVPGSLAIHEVNRALHLELPVGDAYSTVAGLLIDRLGRLPKAGDQVEVEGVVIEVIEATTRRTKTVKVLPRGLVPAPPQAS
jgi:putative hemolysin